MNISRQEAGAALDSIHDAGATVHQHRSYGYAAPYLILWGSIWAACNTVSQFWPQRSALAWIVANVVGTAATAWLVVNTVVHERRRCSDSAEGRSLGRRFSLLGTTLFCYFVAMFLVLAPMTGRRLGAFISLFWTLAYMAAGAWIGRRLFIIGLIGTIGIVSSFLFAGAYFPLAMALFGGGTLIAGGLWLRKL